MKQNQQKRKYQKKQIGYQGERLAAEYLKQKGYQILEYNWTGRWAEIDIVAIEKNTLVFVEVKTRLSERYGDPKTAITSYKIHALTKAGLLYKNYHEDLPDALRIDFVGIDYTRGNPPEITLVKNITG